MLSSPRSSKQPGRRGAAAAGRWWRLPKAACVSSLGVYCWRVDTTLRHWRRGTRQPAAVWACARPIWRWCTGWSSGNRAAVAAIAAAATVGAAGWRATCFPLLVRQHAQQHGSGRPAHEHVGPRSGPGPRLGSVGWGGQDNGYCTWSERVGLARLRLGSTELAGWLGNELCSY